MYLETIIERVWRCTLRLRSSELRDALAGRDRATFEMHLETERLAEHRDALGSHDCASLEMHLEAVIECAKRCTWRLQWRVLGDALGGRDRVN